MLLTEEKKPEPLTMYIQNRRNSSKFKGCSPLQNRNGLISLKPAIAYFAYTKRWGQCENHQQYFYRPTEFHIFEHGKKSRT